jgi:hypothetical protein
MSGLKFGKHVPTKSIFGGKTELLTLLKVIVGVAIILASPVAMVVAVLALRRLAEISWLTNLRINLTREFARPLVVRSHVAFFLLASYLLSCYRDTSNAMTGALLLAILSVFPLALLIPHICVGSKLGKRLTVFLDCPLCVWLRWLALLIIVWAGHATATDKLSQHFQGASGHLPLAYSAGTFMSAVGILSLPTALFVFMCQIIVLLVLGFFDYQPSVLPLKQRIAATISVIASFLSITICYAAQNAIGLSDTQTLIVANFAWNFDMLDEKACTGDEATQSDSNDKSRKIVFVGPDQSKAFLFSVSEPKKPDISKDEARPLRLIRGDELLAKLPKLEKVIACDYRYSSR